MTATARTTGRLLSLAEAAAYVRLAPKTLRNKLSLGTGPRSYHVGAGRQFRVADLDAWIDKHAIPAGRSPRRPNPL
jgi:predicted DNA-binding transcriptional regulator AlpA